VLFFFSSRRRHTRSKRDWSSDVCSSDLVYQGIRNNLNGVGAPRLIEAAQMLGASKFYAFFRVVIPNIMSGVTISVMLAMAIVFRSEERRVGKEWRCWWWTSHYTQKMQ